MTADEFAELYLGRTVGVISKYSDWKDWRGVVIKSNRTAVGTRTIVGGRCRMIGEVVWWYPDQLEIIEEQPTIIIPENNHLCPHCKSVDCKGLAMIECVSRGY